MYRSTKTYQWQQHLFVRQNKMKHCIKNAVSSGFFPQDETDIIFHLRAYDTRSVLLRNVSPNAMFRTLDRQFLFISTESIYKGRLHIMIFFACRQLCQGLTGILQELVRQKMTNILIQVVFKNNRLSLPLESHSPKKDLFTTLPGPAQPGPGGN